MTSSVASMRRELGDGPASLVALDAALSTAVITPVVVSYWRITWKLMDIYMVPGHKTWSIAASVSIGFFGLFAFTLFQHRLKLYLKPRKHTVMYYVMSRGYTAAFAYSCVNSWRGIWDAMDIATGTRPHVVATSVALGICSLAFMRTLRNIIAPPIAILTDSYDGYFEVPTLFRIGARVRFLIYVSCVEIILHISSSRISFFFFFLFSISTSLMAVIFLDSVYNIKNSVSLDTYLKVKKKKNKTPCRINVLS